MRRAACCRAAEEMEVGAKATAAEYEADLQELCAMLLLSKRTTVQLELDRIRSKILGHLTQVKAGWPSEGAAFAPPTAAEAPAVAAAPAVRAVPRGLAQAAAAGYAPEAPS